MEALTIALSGLETVHMVRNTGTSSFLIPAKKAPWTPATDLQLAGKAAQSTEEPLPSRLTADCQCTTFQQGHVGYTSCNVLIFIKLSLLRLLGKTQRHCYSLIFMGLWPLWRDNNAKKAKPRKIQKHKNTCSEIS